MAYREPNTKPDTPGWKVRVVPNLYPAFGRSSGELNSRRVGPYTVESALGVHEVLINSTEHYKDIALLPQEHVSHVLKAYIDRYLVHRSNPNVKYMLIIVNHGKEAGASREHPHAQLFGTPIVPPSLIEEIEGVRRYRAEKGSCPYCDMLSYEMKVGDRVIFENDRFLVFAPYASKVPFETWLMPKNHSANFENMSDQDVHACAEALKNGLMKLHLGLNDPPFNYYIHTAPYQDHSNGDYHWHLEILPKLSIWAGFELGSEIMINTALPESAAEFLRNVPLMDTAAVEASSIK
jgi:UDPglucose--hexose-1-phosphate uridylyltransferase